MRAEIDQSGKIEQLNTHTVVAVSNGIKATVLITSAEKVKLIKTLRNSFVLRRDLNSAIFSGLIFLLISKIINKPNIILIDIEYTGKNDRIEATIESLVKRFKINKFPEIRFKLIGKSSPAHDLAIQTYRRKDKKKSFVIKADEIIKLFRL